MVKWDTNTYFTQLQINLTNLYLFIQTFLQKFTQFMYMFSYRKVLLQMKKKDFLK